MKDVLYAYREGGKDRYYCKWSNSDGEARTWYVYGESAVLALKNKYHFDEVVFVPVI